MIDKATCRNVRAELNPALEEIQEAYGIKFEIGTISFTGTTMSCKLSGTYVGEDASPEEAEQAAFKVNCFRAGVPANWYGEVITVQGRKFAICGVNPKARRNKVSMRCQSTGKVYSTDLRTARNAIEIKAIREGK